MEIIIALVVFGGILWFYYSRDGKKSDEVVTSAPDNVTAPYKVPEPAATTPIPLVVEAVKPVKSKPTKEKTSKPSKKVEVKTESEDNDESEVEIEDIKVEVKPKAKAAKSSRA